MEELIAKCVLFFLSDIREDKKKYNTFKKHYLYVLKQTSNKEYFNYLKNWLLVDSIEEMNDDKYNKIEKDIFKIFKYYYEEIKKIALEYFNTAFFTDDFAFAITKILLELYGEIEFKNAPNYFAEIEHKEDFDNNFSEKEYIFNRLMVQDKFCEDLDFIKICDKLMDDDLTRNIQELEGINAEALYHTIFMLGNFKTHSCLFIYTLSIACYSIRSSVLHYGILKEEPEDFGDIFK